MTPSTLALTGGTGFVGGAVMRLALATGWQIRALTRRPQPAMAGVTWISGALDRPDALTRLVQGSDAVLHVAGVVNVPTRAEFDAGNVTATAAMIDAARQEGIHHFVHVSSLAAREPDLSIYGGSKARAETLVQDSGLDWTIIRPPAVFGPGDAEMLDLFRMVQRGFALLPPSGHMSVIAVSELARLLVALAADRSAGIGQCYEPDDGRPGGWSHLDFAQAIGQAVGRRRIATLTIPRLALQAAGRLDPLVRRGRAKLTPDRARYIAHPDWTANPQAAVPSTIWYPQLDTPTALAETVDWYRRTGWL